MGERLPDPNEFFATKEFARENTPTYNQSVERFFVLLSSRVEKS